MWNLLGKDSSFPTGAKDYADANDKALNERDDAVAFQLRFTPSKICFISRKVMACITAVKETRKTGERF